MQLLYCEYSAPLDGARFLVRAKNLYKLIRES